MEDKSRRIAIGLLAMVGVWVGVYWYWPVEAPISFAAVSAQPGPGGRPEQIDGERALERPVSMPERPAVTADAAERMVLGPTLRQTFAQSEGAGGVRGVVPPRFATHVVGPGETLESISMVYFGTRAHAATIARANPMLSPPDLKPGKEVLVPLDPTNVQGQVATRSDEQAALANDAGLRPQVREGTLPQEYEVQPGDSLARIAKRLWGNEQFSGLIFDANKDRLSDPSRIRVGQRLRIPDRPAVSEPSTGAATPAGGGGN